MSTFMLNMMRRQAKPILWFIVIFVGISFVAFYGYSRAKAPSKDKGDVPDKVGTAFGEPITQNELVFAAAMFGTFVTLQGYSPEDVQRYFDIYDQVERLIILSREAARRQIVVTNEDLAENLQRMPIFRDDRGAFSAERYEATVNRLGLPTEVFERMIRAQLAMTRLGQSVTSGVTISEDEVWRQFVVDTQEASAEIALFRSGVLLADIELTEEEIAAYHAENSSDFMTDEKRAVRYVYLPLSEMMPEVDVTDEEIEKYYNSHIEDYTTKAACKTSHILLRTPAQAEGEPDEEHEAKIEEIGEKAEGILARVMAGEDFGELAKEFSEDPGSKDNGGQLDWIDQGTLVAEFEEAAYSAEPGTIVDHVIQTTYGFHIIKVDELRAEVVAELDEVTAEIRETLEQNKARRLVADALDEIIFDTADGIDFAESAERLALEVREIGPFGLSDARPAPPARGGEADEDPAAEPPIRQLDGAMPFATAAFELPGTGDVSDPVQGENGAYVMELTEVVEPREATLDEARERVERALTRKKAEDAARGMAEQFHARLGEAGDFAALAEEIGGSFEQSDAIRRDGYIPGIGSVEALAEELFRLEPGRTTEPVQVPGGYAVARLGELKPPDEQTYLQQHDTIRMNVLGRKHSRVYTSWYEELKAESGFELLPDVVAMLRR